MFGMLLGCCKNLLEFVEWKIKMIVGLSWVDDLVFSVFYLNWCEWGKKNVKMEYDCFFLG